MSSPYDPRACGAQCDRCPLKDEHPVPPEIHPGATAIIVGEAPGRDEVREGRPFVGASGQEATRAIEKVGGRRWNFTWSNAISCRPPENDMKGFLLKLQRQNRERAAADLPPIPTPMECCLPRLRNELQDYDRVIPMGGFGYQSVVKALGGSFAGTGTSILNARGTMLTIRRPRSGAAEGSTVGSDLGGNELGALDPGGNDPSTLDSSHPADHSLVRIMPTVHPAFVLRMKRWRMVFLADLARAVRWFDGTLKWQAPRAVYRPDVATIEKFLRLSPLAFDTETDGLEPLDANLRCLGVANKDAGIIIPWLSIDGSTRFYSDLEYAEIKKIVAAWFADPRRIKLSWNGGSYDRPLIERYFGVTPVRHLDGILVHKSAASELPHSLAFVGSFYTDVHNWKADHTATEARTDEELHEYCLLDCVITARVIPKITDEVRARDQDAVVKKDHQVQAFCAGMHRNGLLIDQRAREEWEKKLEGERALSLATCQSMSSTLRFNPGSTAQVSRLLFDTWGIPVQDVRKPFTDSGALSTSDDVLRAIMTNRALEPAHRLFAQWLRRYRRSVKFLGTFVRPLRPGGRSFDASHDSELREVLFAEGEYDELDLLDEAPEKATTASRLRPNGRIHADWSSHPPVSGRISSRLQQIPRKLRNMYIPGPGRIFAYADMDQIELRMASVLAGIRKYLDVFEAKGDPHSMTASMIYGPPFDALEKGSVPWEKMRDQSKRVSYGSLYKAEAPTLRNVMASTEIENDDGTTTLPYKDITIEEVAALRGAWLGAIPELSVWWEETIQEWRDQGYLADPHWGRRRDFLDGEDAPELVNFKIQCASVSLVHDATFELLEVYPFEAYGPGTGLVHQGHDALVFEVPENVAQKCADDMTRHMTREFRGLTFSAGAKLYTNWRDKKK